MNSGIGLPRVLTTLLLITLVTGGLTGCRQPTQLERIQERGELIVATRHSPTTWYQGTHGPEGLEYDLVSGFASYIGAKVRFVFPHDLKHLLRQVKHAEAHMAAAGLTVTPARLQALRFSRPYQHITQQLVYRRGARKPRSLAEILPGELQVIADSSHEEMLHRLQEKASGLTWTERTGIPLKQLLRAVNQGTVRYTVADSNELARARQIFRYLRGAFDLSGRQALAWAFPAGGDDSLLRAANQYLAQIRDNGTLALLIDHYQGQPKRLNFVAQRDFQRHIQARLPGLMPYFQEAGRVTGIDWRMLAAIGYQESHWNPAAVSPTGVRGIMMLTASTAGQLGLKDRDDPRQSILGGARYLRIVEKKIPDRIVKPDRLLLTLAGYNIGFGHLEDARILTQRQGGDPDRWEDVKQRLPLLAKKAVYQQLKHGRANGVQAVQYVENIQGYHHLLVWFLNHPEDLEQAFASPSRQTG